MNRWREAFLILVAGFAELMVGRKEFSVATYVSLYLVIQCADAICTAIKERGKP